MNLWLWGNIRELLWRLDYFTRPRPLGGTRDVECAPGTQAAGVGLNHLTNLAR